MKNFMKKGILILIVIIIIGILAFNFFGNKKTSPKFQLTEVIKGEITETITASGTINPVTTTNVGTQVSGTVKEIYADFNSPVKKGQLLAQIDPALFEAKLGQQKANLISAKANLSKLEATLVNDERTLNRYKRLYEKGFIAKSEVDMAQTNFSTDLAQIDAAKAQILQAEASLSSAKTDLAYTKIISPVDGIVVSRNVDLGQTVAASFQTPTLFLVAQDLTKMQINTSVAEADISKVQEGQDVEFTVDGYPEEIFNGSVIQVRNSPTTVQNVVTYDVVVGLDNKEMKLKPGMTANVTIITVKKEDALLLSNDSFRFTMQHGKDAPKYKQKGVWVLKQDKNPLRIEVKTGISDENYTEIISGDINPGDKVVTGYATNTKNKNNDRQRPMRIRMF
ncbi:MAG: efflux RND transporter periplasmic adaptor subunit [Candidatus Gastranaerophilales bacterium]|nr:efflux RND transporter periplasmic adaptor subunit [Candidatus Gastranaerophilales bacterium]